MRRPSWRPTWTTPGGTSVDVRLRAFREDSTTGEREATTESHSEYVTIDGGGEPMLVPELTVESDRGQCLRQRALDDGADGDA